MIVTQYNPVAEAIILHSWQQSTEIWLLLTTQREKVWITIAGYNVDHVTWCLLSQSNTLHLEVSPNQEHSTSLFHIPSQTQKKILNITIRNLLLKEMLKFEVAERNWIFWISVLAKHYKCNFIYKEVEWQGSCLLRLWIGINPATKDPTQAVQTKLWKLGE